MPSGGARARSGPAPDPQALRRDRDSGDWTTLSAEGRVGDPPAWPLTEASARESVLWAQQWKRPQAVIWERNGQELEVAMFVRSLVAAEKGDASVTSRTLVRQQMDSLLLTAPSLRAARLKIAEKEAPAKRGKTRTAASRPSARTRLTVVTGGNGKA